MGEKRDYQDRNIVWFLALLLFSMVLVSGCSIISSSSRLKPVEIRDYNGQRLDSIGKFRENSIRGPQDVDLENYSLEITGLVKSPVSMSYEEVLGHKRYSKVVELNCVEGWSVKILWEGVLVSDLIDEAGAMPQANTVIFHAYDGYTTSLSLKYIRDNNILLAYKMNNITLPAERGFPFQLVAEDKWGYKWIKWVTRIELSDDEDYKGYWESRGYNANGDLNGSKFET